MFQFLWCGLQRAAVRNATLYKRKITCSNVSSHLYSLCVLLGLTICQIPTSLRLSLFLNYFYPLKSQNMTVVATEHDPCIKYSNVFDKLLCQGFCSWRLGSSLDQHDSVCTHGCIHTCTCWLVCSPWQHLANTCVSCQCDLRITSV